MLISLRAARLPFFDQIRALAICAVVVVHYRSDWLPGGGVGVGLFFALSGFLISGLLLEMEINPGAVGAFVFRRFMRVFPALALVAVLAFALMALRWPDKQPTAAAALLPLLTFWKLPTEWLGFSFGVLWTLHVEFWFYVYAAIAVLVLGKGRAFAAACIATIVLSFAIRFVPPPAVAIGYEFFFKWGGCLALGGLVAWAWKNRLLRLTRRQAMALIAVALAGFAALCLPGPGGYWGWFAEAFGASVCGSMMIAGLICVPTFRLPVPLEPIGRMSYSMYLLHGVLLDYGPALGLPMQPLPYFVALIAISALSFRLIEQPGIQLGHWLISSRSSQANAMHSPVTTPSKNTSTPANASSARKRS